MAAQGTRHDWPSDWSDYKFLVLELKTTTPQRFSIYLYTADGPRRIMFQPFGQNVWLRASVPLRYFQGMDQSGTDLASTNNRRTRFVLDVGLGPVRRLEESRVAGPDDGVSACQAPWWKSAP